jgi:hypothetical protein
LAAFCFQSQIPFAADSTAAIFATGTAAIKAIPIYTTSKASGSTSAAIIDNSLAAVG